MSDAINPDHYKRLPAEAIEIIEAAIDSAPSVQAAYLHGQVLKYILRCWHKNGIEDLKKAKWYLDRLIDSFDESEQQPVIKQSLTTEPPGGWRWLEVGELMRKGDADRSCEPIYKNWIGSVCRVYHNVLRRNKFYVGEKVVHVDDSKPTPYAIAGYNDSWGAYAIKYKEGEYLYHPNKLAPYIEEQT